MLGPWVAIPTGPSCDLQGESSPVPRTSQRDTKRIQYLDAKQDRRISSYFLAKHITVLQSKIHGYVLCRMQTKVWPVDPARTSPCWEPKGARSAPGEVAINLPSVCRPVSTCYLANISSFEVTLFRSSKRHWLFYGRDRIHPLLYGAQLWLVGHKNQIKRSG